MTASCTNHECAEFGVAKDMSTVPPGWTDPIWCGQCGQEIAHDPPEIDNTLPEVQP